MPRNFSELRVFFPSFYIHLFLCLLISLDFETLYDEANDLLETGKVEGIMEDLFAGIEFIKWKGDSRLSVARIFEEKHGYGVAINKNDFSGMAQDCLFQVIDFISNDIVANISRVLKSHTVRECYK